MKLKFLGLIVSSTLAFNAHSQSISSEKHDFFRELVDELVRETQNQGDPDRVGIASIPKPIPLGDQKAPLPPECHPHEFQRKVLTNYQNPFQYGRAVKNYFNKCSEYLTEGNTKGLIGLLKFAMTEYDLSKNPLITKQDLKLSDGNTVEAYIGVKKDRSPRPWVIVKCGVFCDITSSASTLNFVINLFDQSPFNVIFVSNHTGTDHIKNNSSLTIGGFYEVYDFYDIAQWLKFDSPYRDTVESIHATGISLGGSSAMAVGHLSHLFRSRDGNPLFQSSTAICPVVNLGPTLKDMYGNSTKGKLFTRLTWKYLKDAAPYLPEAQDYLAPKSAPPSEKFPPMLGDIVLRYGIPWEKSNPPGRSAPLPTGIDDLMEKNNFAYDNHRPDVPTLAWASFDDHIVNYSLNTKTLVDNSNPYTEQGAVGLEYGDHCGFVSAYGFSATTAVLQSFILNNSPNFKAQRHTRTMAIPGKLPNFLPADIHLRQWWMINEEKGTVTLNYETFNGTLGLICRFADPFKSASSCRSSYRQTIPIKALAALNVTIPKNATEAQILSRFLNGLLRVTHRQTPVDGTVFLPTHLTWSAY